MSAPRAPARIVAPGLDSMLSSSPASKALCAVAPFFSGTISIFRPCFDAKSRCPTITMKPASPFGSMTPCFHGLRSWPEAGTPRRREQESNRETSQDGHAVLHRLSTLMINGQKCQINHILGVFARNFVHEPFLCPPFPSATTIACNTRRCGCMVQRVATVAFEGIEARAVDVQVQVARVCLHSILSACPTRLSRKPGSACVLRWSPPVSRFRPVASPSISLPPMFRKRAATTTYRSRSVSWRPSAQFRTMR